MNKMITGMSIDGLPIMAGTLNVFPSTPIIFSKLAKGFEEFPAPVPAGWRDTFGLLELPLVLPPPIVPKRFLD